MKAILVALGTIAVLLGGAGVGTLVLQHRLAALAPGGLDAASLHYNPFSGRLALAGVRARDAGGHELFRADEVVATVTPFRLLARPLTLNRARVTAPRVTLRAAAGFDLAGLAADLGAAPAAAVKLPVRIEDLIVAGGSLVVEGAGAGGAPLVVKDLDLRLSRLTTATIDQQDVAFAVEMAVYGTTVYVTGQPRGRGYAVHVRARGLDAPRLARDAGIQTLQGLQRGQGDIDADLLLIEGRLLASGSARLTDAVLALPVPGRPRLRAATLAVVLDNVDVATGAGRITRLDLGTPTLSVPAAGAASALAALIDPLRSRADVLVRRIVVTDGTLALEGAGGLRLERVQLAAHAPERRGDGAWIMSARAGLGADAEIALDGVVARDLRALDAVARLHRVAVAPWRTLAGAPADWDARVSFDGRLDVAARGDQTAVTLAGQAVLADVGGPGRGGFRADRIALGIRRLQWPTADTIVDTVVMTRPAFALPAALPWPHLVVTGGVSIVDGELRDAGAGRALHGMEASLVPAEVVGGARLRLSASTDGGHRLGVDRIVPYDAPVQGGVPFGLLLGALQDAARPDDGSSAPPSAMPATVLTP
jgi:hypothetical protein